jgi:hypothetical protein
LPSEGIPTEVCARPTPLPELGRSLKEKERAWDQGEASRSLILDRSADCGFNPKSKIKNPKLVGKRGLPVAECLKLVAFFVHTADVFVPNLLYHSPSHRQNNASYSGILLASDNCPQATRD